MQNEGVPVRKKKWEMRTSLLIFPKTCSSWLWNNLGKYLSMLTDNGNNKVANCEVVTLVLCLTLDVSLPNWKLCSWLRDACYVWLLVRVVGSLEIVPCNHSCSLSRFRKNSLLLWTNLKFRGFLIWNDNLVKTSCRFQLSLIRPGIHLNWEMNMRLQNLK